MENVEVSAEMRSLKGTRTSWSDDDDDDDDDNDGDVTSDCLCFWQDPIRQIILLLGSQDYGNDRLDQF